MGEALRFGDIIRTYDNAEYLVLDRVAPMAPKRMTESVSTRLAEMVKRASIRTRGSLRGCPESHAPDKSLRCRCSHFMAAAVGPLAYAPVVAQGTVVV